MPRYSTRPQLGRRKPVMMLNAVVLPAPFGPIRLTMLALGHLETQIGDGAQPAEMDCRRPDTIKRQGLTCGRGSGHG